MWTTSVIEALLTFLLSEKMGTSVSPKEKPSPEVAALRAELNARLSAGKPRRGSAEQPARAEQAPLSCTAPFPDRRARPGALTWCRASARTAAARPRGRKPASAD